ncbi:hypothetical protein [Streptomyces enissocaesilis]|uniref:Uncharacterized protein n=1 Tax=Streptomyces enissocaesilis TaxID=332589 RepID=A0ABP6K6I9_9ACTN
MDVRGHQSLAAKTGDRRGGETTAPRPATANSLVGAAPGAGATRRADEITLLPGVADVAARKRFPAGRGPAKDVGVTPDGTGSHRRATGGMPGPSPARTGSYRGDATSCVTAADPVADRRSGRLPPPGQ